MKKLSVLGVNCGNGVILHPFLKSKYFDVIGGIEPRGIFKTPQNIQWTLNFGKIPLYHDLGGEKLRGVQPDVIIGAPDCGHSSVLALSRAKKYGVAKDNKSLTMFWESITLFKPNFFLFENLPGLLKQVSLTDIKELCPEYSFIVYQGSVSVFGNSQISRKRLIIVGIKGNHKKIKKSFKLPSIKLKRVKELEAALIDPSDALCNVREDAEQIITIFGGCRMLVSDIQQRWITELRDKKRWPTGELKMVNAPGVYKNLPDAYPLTVRKGNREFNSRGLMMSPRERARIMGIPDDFNIWYESAKKTTCINKGRVTVTKTIPYEIAVWFKKALIKNLKRKNL
jgi:site-specific DNA-cytosine methylase